MGRTGCFQTYGELGVCRGPHLRNTRRAQQPCSLRGVLASHAVTLGVVVWKQRHRSQILVTWTVLSGQRNLMPLCTFLSNNQ